MGVLQRVGYVEQKLCWLIVITSIENHATELPLCARRSAHSTARDVLPKPAGALTTERRLLWTSVNELDQAGTLDKPHASRWQQLGRNGLWMLACPHFVLNCRPPAYVPACIPS